jgi:hypothetical protein
MSKDIFSETKKVDTPSDTSQQQEGNPQTKIMFPPFEQGGPSPVNESSDGEPPDKGSLNTPFQEYEKAIPHKENQLIQQNRLDRKEVTPTENQLIQQTKLD